MKARFVVPLLCFGVLVAFLAAGLHHDPHEIPSPLVNQTAPDFKAPQLVEQSQFFSPTDLRGQVWVLNVWASWCTACREEHPALLAFSRSNAAPLIGLDYKDQRGAALKVLGLNGDPYQLSAVDADGRVGIDYGVYGVPETYVIDKAGVIRYKQIGPVTPEVLKTTIYPLIESLKKS
jgi:cytochrome c biogenesis protein CcmG/thiol:disulfide interchange protein DsbE